MVRMEKVSLLRDDETSIFWTTMQFRLSTCICHWILWCLNPPFPSTSGDDPSAYRMVWHWCCNQRRESVDGRQGWGSYKKEICPLVYMFPREQEKPLLSMGFPIPILKPPSCNRKGLGTPFFSSGNTNLKKSRNKFKNVPTLIPNLEQLQWKIIEPIHLSENLNCAYYLAY